MNNLKRLFLFIIISLFAIPSFAYNKSDLYKAVRSNNIKDVKKILAVAPNLNVLRYDNDNNTILMVALEKKVDKKIIDILLLSGCAVDVKNKSGQTAVMLAAENLKDKKLLKRIVDFNLFSKKSKIERILQKDNNGQNAFDYAKDNKVAYDLFLTYTDNVKTDDTENAETTETETADSENATDENTTDATEVTEVASETEQVATDENVASATDTLTDSASDIAKSATSAVTNTTAISATSATEIASSAFIGTVGTVAVPPTVTSENTESSDDANGENSKDDDKTSTTDVDDDDKVESTDDSASSGTDGVSSDSDIAKSASDGADSTADDIASSADDAQTAEKTDKSSTEKSELDIVINVPKIDYYNRNKPEYLFEEIEVKANKSTLETLQKSTVSKIKDPDLLDNNGRSRLMNAIITNDLPMCYSLLTSGANANLKDANGWTPLMYAAKYARNPEIVILLFNHKADITLKNNSLINALQIASAFSKDKDIINIFLKNAKVSNLNIHQALCIALKEEQEAIIIKQYLPYLKNINSLYRGKTFLMYAASYYEKTDVIKLLLESNADPYIVSIEKKNAFGYAKENSKIIKDSIYWSLNVAENKR